MPSKVYVVDSTEEGYYSGNPLNGLRDEPIACQGIVKCIDHVLPLFAGSRDTAAE